MITRFTPFAAAGLACVLVGCAAEQSKSKEGTAGASDVPIVATLPSFERSVPTHVDRQWLERELAREVLHSLEPHLGKMGLDSPEGRELAARIVPAGLSERMRVNAKAGERPVLFVRPSDATEFGEVKKWLDTMYGAATTRRFSNHGGAWPREGGVVGPLPDDPVLRMMVAMQMDWLGVLSFYVEDPNPALPPPAAKPEGARQSARERHAPRSMPSKRPDDTPEIIEARNAKIEACRERSAALISDALAEAVASPAFAGERIKMLGLVVVWLNDRDFDRVTHLRAAERYAARPDADPWLAALYRGTVLHEMAWDARGHAYAAETSPEQFAKFQAHLDQSYAALKEAHRLAPERAHAAGILVGVALGSRNPEHEPPEFWFDAAIDNDRTWSDAFAWMTSVVLDRWGGDPEDRVSLLRKIQGAARRRGGGAVAMRVPTLLYRAIEDNPELKKDARWSLEYQACLQPLWINATDQTASFTGVDPDEAWSMALVCATMAGDVTTAWALLDEPGRRFIRSDVEEFKMTWAQIEKWAMVRHPTDGKTYLALRMALAQDNLAEAVNLAGELVKTTKSPRMAEAGQRVLDLQALQMRLDAGETIDLLAPPQKSWWEGSASVLAASEVEDENAGLVLKKVVLQSGEDDEVRFPLALRRRLRIEMDIELPERLPGQTADARLTVRMGNPKVLDAPATFNVFVSNTSIQSMMGDRARRSRERLPLKVTGEKHSLVIEMDGSRGCLLVDGKVWDVYEPSPTLGKGEVPPLIEGVLGVSGILPRPDSSIRIGSIKISRPTEALGEREIEATP